MIQSSCSADPLFMPSLDWDRRDYDAERYLRMKRKLADLLGGKCESCGETDLDLLEFDHLEQETKKFNITSVWARGKVVRDELKKCRLLCYGCHKERTKVQAQVEHGGGKTGRKGCKCDLCRARRAAYMKERRSQTT